MAVDHRSGSVAAPDTARSQGGSEVARSRRRGSLRRWLGRACVGLFISLASLWAIAAIWFSPLPAALRTVLCAAYFLAVIGCLVVHRARRWAALVSLGLFAAVLVPWLRMAPSNNRNWQPDVQQTAYCEVVGNRVTIHNVRFASYRTEKDFTVRYETREYDLDKLRSADMYLVDWGLRHVAHTMLSFGFGGDQYLCFSIETRKEVGEGYSTIKGFFHQYGIIYIAADERDLVKLRTNYRQGEDVYLYRLKPRNPAVVREVFLEYVQRLNQLHEKPEWYNALTDNCMTSAYKNIRKHAERASWNWRVFLNGHMDELAYMDGSVDTLLPFAQLRQRSLINDRARNVGDDPDFSRAIRRGLPGMEAESRP